MSEQRLQTLSERYRYAYQYHRLAVQAALTRYRAGDLSVVKRLRYHCKEARYWSKQYLNEINKLSSASD
jgi:hypothetical protein